MQAPPPLHALFTTAAAMSLIARLFLSLEFAIAAIRQFVVGSLHDQRQLVLGPALARGKHGCDLSDD